MQTPMVLSGTNAAIRLGGTVTTSLMPLTLTTHNEFLQQQIAGDVLRPEDPAAVIATGFLAAGPWDFVGQVETKSDVLRRSARALDLDDMVTQVMTCTRRHHDQLCPLS